MSKNALVLPIQLDAIYLTRPSHCAPPRVDFTRLPQRNEREDLNSDTPYLGEEIQAIPFHLRKHGLEKGVHLHWALPAVFTKASKIASTKTPPLATDSSQQEEVETASTGKPSFPAVPDLWLITRTGGGLVDRKWLLESSYLHPAEQGNPQNSTAYPFSKNKDNTEPSHRYLGRVTALKDESTEPSLDGGTFLPALTTIGYGEPTFAAYYPNCRGVFGFFDPLLEPKEGKEEEEKEMVFSPIADNAGVNYQIVGIYQNADLDLIKQIKTSLDQGDRLENSDFGLKIFAKEDGPSAYQALDGFASLTASVRTVLFGQVTCSGVATTVSPKIDALAVGNTGGEALAAYLGQQLGKGEAGRKVEALLESLQLAPQLAHLEADTIAKFKELRHAKGFKSQAAGLRWTIRPVQDPGQQAHAPSSPNHVKLPESLAIGLHELNQLQLGLDRLGWQIGARKKQLYATWTKYMVSKYPPDVFEAAYPDVDELRFFLEQAELKALASLTEAWKAQRNAVGEKITLLTEALFEVQQVRLEDVTDWSGFHKDFATAFPTHSLLWTDEEKEGLVQKLNQLLEIGGVFSHRPKEQFFANRPAYDQPLLVEDFDNWSVLVTGLEELKKANEKDADVIEEVNKAFLNAGVSPHIFANKIGKKKEKYIQPLELAELNGTLEEVLEAAVALSSYLESVLSKHSDAAANANAIKHLNEVMAISRPGEKGLLAPVHLKHKELQKLNAKDQLKPGEHLRYNRLVLEQMFPSLKRRPAYEFQSEGQQRFVQPTDPVILLAGEALQGSSRHGQTGLLPSLAIQLAEETAPATLLGELKAYHSWLTKEIDGLTGTDGVWRGLDFINHSKTPSTERHPLLLDWQVEYYPAETAGEGDLQKTGYPAGYLQDNFEFTPREAELVAKQSSHAAGGHSFAGTTILSSHAKELLSDALTKFIGKDQSKEEFNGAGYTAVPEKDKRRTGTIVKWYKKPGELVKKDDLLAELNSAEGKPIEVVANAAGTLLTIIKGERKKVTSEDILGTILTDAKAIVGDHLPIAIAAFAQLHTGHYLSQSIGGFHQALLQHKQGYQLNIDDPLGFPEYQRFTQRVRDVVGNLNHSMILPHSAFFPIRAGAMNIVDLRLLDTFGREIFRLRDQKEKPKVTAAEPLAPTETAYDLALSPRIVQPTRLEFRWLSATNDALAMNDHLATSPVCGWVVLNELDSSLLLYDRRGKALGYIDREQRWRVSPGLTGPAVPAGITNSHLRQLVNWIIGQDKASWAAFFTRLDAGLDNIETDHSDQHQGIALLMRQPLALVRAKVQLEIQGAPAQHQGWEHLQRELREFLQFGTATHQTLGFENVRIPFRLGEDHKLNDGLVAFWVENETTGTYAKDRFYTPLDAQNDFSLTATGSHQISDSGLTFSLLLDPTGAVHLTTGILPVATLQIPHQQYAEAVSSIEITFQTAPLLTHQGLINASLPEEAGYAWSWLEKDPQGWRELSTVGHLKVKELEKVFGDQSAMIWQTLQDNGYLEVDQTTNEGIITVGKAKKKLADIAGLADLAPKLELFLNGQQILPFQTSGTFAGPQEIREGWLKLRSVKPPVTNVES